MNLADTLKNNLELNRVISKLQVELTLHNSVHVNCNGNVAENLRREGFEVKDGGQREGGYFISFKKENQRD